MLFTTHAITGATVGLLSGNPILAFFVGWISHYILDSLPHFDQGSFYMEKDKGPSWVGAKYAEKKKFIGKGEKRDWIILFIDFGVAFIIGLLFLVYIPSSYWLLLILGGFGGILPDVLGASPFWGERFKDSWIGRPMHAVHHFLHWPLSTKHIYLGLGIQVFIVLGALFYLIIVF